MLILFDILLFVTAYKQVLYDPRLLWVTLLLLALGFITLFSALLGVDTDTHLYLSLITQGVGMALGVGLVYMALYVKKLDYRCLYKKHYALYFFAFALAIQLLVFSPLGVERNGALRWIDFGLTTFQPSELFKIAVILLVGSLLVGYRKRLRDFKVLLCICLSTVGVFSAVMLLIRDKGSLVTTVIAVFCMLLASRVRFSHLFVLVVLSVTALLGVLALEDSTYATERIISFLGINPNPLGSDYQVNQALMTIGSGEIVGKGFGNSIQKYEYLPEPLTDSIFALYAEEWGFIGSLVLILLYVFFLLCAMSIARKARDDYGRYIAIGLSFLILLQSLFNIMALIKLVPLSGMPLVFVSKGGTSILTSLLIVALLMNISRISLNTRRKK